MLRQLFQNPIVFLRVPGCCKPGILLFFIFTIIQAAAQPKALLRDVYLEKNAALLKFGNSKLEVQIRLQSGNLLQMNLRGKGPFVQTGDSAATEVLVEGQSAMQHHATGSGYSTKINARCVSLHVVQMKPGSKNRITTAYILYPGRAVVERVVQVVSGADSVQQINGFLFHLPRFVAGATDDCVVNVPGPFWPTTFTPPDMPYDSLKHKTISYHAALDGGFGLFSLSNKKERTTITTFLKTDGDANYHTTLSGNGAFFSLRQKNNRAVYIAPGASARSDTQHIAITQTFDEALAAYRNVSMRAMPLANRPPAWTRDAVILEIFPDYFKGGFAEITAKLPFYKDIGFNTIYLMPHWNGGYSPIDLYEIKKEYGTKEALQGLVQTAHGLGMRVLFDMVIHGFNTASPVIKQHPEFFYRDKRDSLVIHPSWGSVMTDFSNPAYQQYMKDYVLYEQQTFGIDGYRVDAASYKGPNWNRQLPYPAYKSGSAAPQLMKLMLDALRRKNSAATLLSEVFGPVFYTVSNFAHDNQTEALSFLIKEMEQGRYHFSQYKKHLQYVYACLPPGARRVFYTRNHDTSWFYEFNGYTPLFLTLEAIHAFFGVPEVFAGDPGYKFNPDDDPATYGFYKNLFAARARHAEFVQGRKLFDAADCDDADIFTGMAMDKKKTSVFVASGAGAAKEVAVTLAATYRNKKFRATDIIQQINVPVVKTKTGFTLLLQPYQVVVVQVQP